MEFPSKPPWRFGRAAVCLALISMVLPASVSGQAVDEYAVKAAFLYNFTKFVEWPDAQGEGTFNICITGDDPFGGSLDRLVQGKTANGRKILIRRLKELGEARQCQIVFLGREEEAKASKLVEAVRGAPVLTVGEPGKFEKMGGMIVLSMNEGRVAVRVNAAATESCGLKVSARLMSLATRDMGESGGR